MTKLPKILTLTSISIVLSLFFAEISLRILGIHPPIFQLTQGMVKASSDPILGYELNPEHPEVNSLGLKEPEFLPTKPAATYRIVALGDSVTFGCCSIPSLPGYPATLAQALLPPAPTAQLEVINAGVVGYNTVQEAELFTSKITALEPDFLILQITLNDFEPKTFEYDDLIATLSPEKQPQARQFYDLLEKTKAGLSKSVLFQELAYYFLLNQQTAPNQNQPSQPVHHRWQDYSTITDGLSLLKQHLPAHLRSKVLVVLFPYFVTDLADYPEDLLAEHAAIATTSTTAGFAFLDLLPCFQTEFDSRHESFQQTLEDIAHPNAYGHQVAAECIAAKLTGEFGFELNSLYSFSTF